MLSIEWIQNISTIKDAQLVKINLNICLQSASLTWYISELFNLKRIGLQNNENSVKKWCWALKNWFKKSAAVTLISLTFTKYIMTDIKSHCEPFVYVQTILYHAKFANINNIENQLTFIY